MPDGKGPPLVPLSTPWVAKHLRASVTWVEVSCGNRPRTCATAPDTCGVAIEVPEIETIEVSDEDQAAVMPDPGAYMSRHGPSFEKSEVWSWLVVDPIVRASGALAGETLHASAP